MFSIIPISRPGSDKSAHGHSRISLICLIHVNESVNLVDRLLVLLPKNEALKLFWKLYELTIILNILFAHSTALIALLPIEEINYDSKRKVLLNPIFTDR